jgi:hypothetical protein
VLLTCRNGGRLTRARCDGCRCRCGGCCCRGQRHSSSPEHEALYWAERELQKAMLVTDAIKKGTRSWNPWTESAHFSQ